MKLGLLNTTIMTTDGTYTCRTIDLREAKDLIDKHIGNLDPAIGHKSTAEIMSALLDIKIPVNRQNFSQKVGQSCLVFKVKDRVDEGRILTREEIEEIGYEFKVLKRMY